MRIMIHLMLIVILALSLLLVVRANTAPSPRGEYVDPIQVGRETEGLGDQQQ